MAASDENNLRKEKVMKFYMHAGSGNHGCEAIVRSTAKMAGERPVLYSEHPEEDLANKLDEICDIRLQGGSRSKKNPAFILCKAVEVLLKNSKPKQWYAYKNVISDAKAGELYVSIGGDNYCYGANPYLIYLNDALNKKGARTGLWGCSIEPEVLKDPKIIDDMEKYSFISARETITYNALKSAGLNKVYLYPDPAFTLETRECALPEQFKTSGIVGINISPLVQKLDKTSSLVVENYVELVRYILKNTDLTIAFIPHVCKTGNDDRESIRHLLSLFPDEKERLIAFIENKDMDCRELKYIISRCRFMITARTHASIAAYSTCVPTLVVGYSVKARGIAKDLFGTHEHYVADIHDLQGMNDLTDCFRWIMEREDQIREQLVNEMPEYIEKAKAAGSLLK